MSDRKVIRVSEETEAAIRAYAESKRRPDGEGGEILVTVGEAADMLIGTAIARLAALKRYGSNKTPQAPGKPRKAAKKASAKKASAKKVSTKKAASATNGAAEHHAEA